MGWVTTRTSILLSLGSLLSRIIQCLLSIVFLDPRRNPATTVFTDWMLLTLTEQPIASRSSVCSSELGDAPNWIGRNFKSLV